MYTRETACVSGLGVFTANKLHHFTRIQYILLPLQLLRSIASFSSLLALYLRKKVSCINNHKKSEFFLLKSGLYIYIIYILYVFYVTTNKKLI